MSFFASATSSPRASKKAFSASSIDWQIRKYGTGEYLPGSTNDASACKKSLAYVRKPSGLILAVAGATCTVWSFAIPVA